MEKQGGLARRRRALEGGATDADHGAPFGEARDEIPQSLRAGHGVKLVPALREPWRGLQVVVRAQRDNQNVGLVLATVRADPPPLRVDGGDRLVNEAHAGLGEVAVREADRLRRLSPEHQVEL